MDFMWAVEQLNKGKKVRRNQWVLDGMETLKLELVDDYSFKFTNCVNNNLCATHVTLKETESTDWVLFDDDSEWNLANAIDNKGIGYDYDKLIKCRDLIIKDINELKVTSDFKGKVEIDKLEVYNIVNKCFGELK